MFLLASGCLYAGPLFPGSLSSTFSFAESADQAGVRMTLAWDGANYWSVTGGGWGGVRQASYGADGSLTANYSPGIDFRSIFTDTAGNVYARGYNSRSIYAQAEPGLFSAVVTLQDGTLDPQASVVLNSTGTEYLAMSEGVVYRWSLSGIFLGSVGLSGFGALSGESNYPQNRGIAVWNDYWLTYSDQILSAWDSMGNRVDSTTLMAAGLSADANFSFSVANGMFFVEDDGVWRGYEFGSSLNEAGVPEPATAMLMGLGGLFIAWRLRRRSPRNASPKS
jgi:hypothetical protein